MDNSLELPISLPFVCDGNIIIAVSSKALDVLKPIDLEPDSLSNRERRAIVRSLAEAVSFLHSCKIFLGSDIHQNNVLLRQSKEELTAAFRTEKMAPLNGNTMAKMIEDHEQLANFLCYYWLCFL